MVGFKVVMRYQRKCSQNRHGRHITFMLLLVKTRQVTYVIPV